VTLKLLSYNIRYGGVGREQRLASVIRAIEPDIVVFQEATRPAVIEELAMSTGMNAWAARPGFSTGFMSRVGVAHHEWHRPRGARHAFLEIVLAPSGLRVFGLHLSAIHSKWSERRRVRELRSLLEGVLKEADGFHVLTGDFNSLAPGELLDARRMPHWIRALIWMSGRDIQRDTVGLMLGAGYVDGYRALHPTDGGFTFPTWDPHLRLDYVFVPATYADRLTTCTVVNGPTGASEASDHFPLLAHLEAA
jgi:endonuclease/exonuclease/phosphatase family metal-dependent hydrolase